jgi:hypothetical protein
LYQVKDRISGLEDKVNVLTHAGEDRGKKPLKNFKKNMQDI